MNASKIVKKANDIINSDEDIKSYYPYISEIYIQPLEPIQKRDNGYHFGICKFNIHLTVTMKEFSTKLIYDVRNNVYNPKSPYSPMNDYLFYNYQIDTGYLISNYIRKSLSKHNISFNSWDYKEDVYSSDGKNITVLEKVFNR